MATSKTLQLGPHLPAGGSVKAYLDPNQTHRTNPPGHGAAAAGHQSAAAAGAVVDTQTIAAGGTVTFVGLTDKRQYVAGLDIGGGVWKYIQFDSF